MKRLEAMSARVVLGDACQTLERFSMAAFMVEAFVSSSAMLIFTDYQQCLMRSEELCNLALPRLENACGVETALVSAKNAGAPSSMTITFVVVVKSNGLDRNEKRCRPLKKTQRQSADVPHNSLGNLLGRDGTQVLKRRAKRIGVVWFKHHILIFTMPYIVDENPRRMYTSPTRQTGRHPPCNRAEFWCLYGGRHNEIFVFSDCQQRCGGSTAGFIYPTPPTAMEAIMG